MPRRPAAGQGRGTTAALGLMAVLLVAFIIIYPDEAFQSSLSGLRLWWTLVFPALLPFLMVTEILTGLGVIRLLGFLMEPAMRILFRIPGAGGWVAASGLVAGYPSGAALTARLVQKGGWRRGEAERLLSLSHLCNPVVIVTVAGAGFLHSARAGLFVAAVHYISAAAVSLAMRGLPDGPVLTPDGASHVQQTNPAPNGSTKSVAALLVYAGRPAAEEAVIARATRSPRRTKKPLRRLAAEMQRARTEDGRTFGKLLGDAVTISNQALLTIGGYMIIFSVLGRMISLVLPDFVPQWAVAFLPGALEPHLGASAAAASTDGMLKACAWIGAFLGWSGLSLHAQVRSLVHGSGVRYAPFLLGRVLHGTAAFFLTFLLGTPLAGLLFPAEPSFRPSDGGAGLTSGMEAALGAVWHSMDEAASALLVSVTVLLTASAALRLANRVKRRFYRR